MPRDYAKFRSRFWTGQTGKIIRSLGPDVQVTAAYLITCASSNMIGLYYLPLSLLCHETGITLEGARKALRSLSEVDFAHYDESEEVVFVTRMAPEQIEEQLEATDKRCAGVARELKEYEKSRFFSAFVHLYGTAFNLPKSMGEGRPLEGPSKVLRSQEQEQENEQENEQEQDSDCAETPRAASSTPVTEPPLLTFPCDGKTREWALTQSQVDRWSGLFPSLDVMAEARGALAWCEANPSKRKTAGGMPKFLVAWLTRSQNSGKGSGQRSLLTPGQRDVRHGMIRAEDCKHEETGEMKL
jgi:hypothetical protein